MKTSSHPRRNKQAAPARAPASGPALHALFYKVIARIPYGKVATYGQIASLAGLPRHARHVGFALSALAENSKLPWHRVVNAQGGISARSKNTVFGLMGERADDWVREHRQRLLTEGIIFDKRGHVPLMTYQWLPNLLPPR